MTGQPRSLALLLVLLAAPGSALAQAPPTSLRAPDGEGLVELFCTLAEQGAMGSHEHAGLHITYNTTAELADAERKLEQYYTLREQA